MTVWSTLDAFLAGETPLEDFSRWVDETPALADLLAPEELTALRQLDARTAKARVAAIYEAHRPGRLARDRAERIARGMLSGDIPAGAGVRALAALHREGQDWIPVAFVGLETALDDLPATAGNPLTDVGAFSARVRAAIQKERELRAPALVAARRLLERL
jgi:hypothetical protein